MSGNGAHDGHCLNMPGQKPEDYDPWDSCYLHLEASDRRWGQVNSIVRDLAATDPLDSAGGCGHCGAPLRPDTASDPTLHHDSCLWRRAVEWTTQEDNT